MTASGEDALPAPAAEALEGVRSREERLEHVLETFVPLPTDGGQPALRHRHRMRLLGQLDAARGLSEKQRAALENVSPTDGPLFEFNVLRVDGWTREDNGSWRPPADPRAVLPLADIAPVDDPRAIVMKDKTLNSLIDNIDTTLEEVVPYLEQEPSADEPLATSIALVRAALYYLVQAQALVNRECDPEQRARRHARRLELIGHAFARRGVSETDLEGVRPQSLRAEVLFTQHALKTDGWTGSSERGWTPPTDAGATATPT